MLSLMPLSLLEALILAVGRWFPDLRPDSEPVLQRNPASGTCKDALTLETSCSPLFLPLESLCYPLCFVSAAGELNRDYSPPP